MRIRFLLKLAHWLGFHWMTMESMRHGKIFIVGVNQSQIDAILGINEDGRWSW